MILTLFLFLLAGGACAGMWVMWLMAWSWIDFLGVSSWDEIIEELMFFVIWGLACFLVGMFGILVGLMTLFVFSHNYLLVIGFLSLVAASVVLVWFENRDACYLAERKRHGQDTNTNLL